MLCTVCFYSLLLFRMQLNGCVVMSEQDKILQLVSSLYTAKDGGPATFASAKRMKDTLKLQGYDYPIEKIQAALEKIKLYRKFQSKYITKIPKHVSLRYLHVSHPNLQFFADSMVVTTKQGGGWLYGFKYAQVILLNCR